MADLDQHLPGIVAGDPDAFGRWVAGAEPRLRASLRRFATKIDAEAVLQEALLRVWQVAPRFVSDGRPDGLLRLGVRISRNVAIGELRRRRPDAVDPQVLEALAGAGQEIAGWDGPDPLLRRVIERCRDRLPAKPASALQARLRAAGGQSDQDLAAALGMKRNTFLQNFTRARRFLADCLAEHGVDLEAVLP